MINIDEELVRQMLSNEKVVSAFHNYISRNPKILYEIVNTNKEFANQMLSNEKVADAFHNHISKILGS